MPTSKKPSICVLSFEDIALEYRVRNQLISLSERYPIVFIGIGDWTPPENISYQILDRTPKDLQYYIKYLSLLLIGRIVPSFYKRIFCLKPEYKRALQIIRENDYGLIHANDWDGLYISVCASEGSRAKIIFDAHEYSEEQESENLLWRFFVKPFRQWIFRKHLPKVDKVITVSEPIAALFRENYGIKEPAVVHNTSFYIKNKYRETNPDSIQIIYQGAAIRTRRLEEIIQLSALLDDRYTVNLMLYPQDRKYYTWLKQKCIKYSDKRVRIIDFVEYILINDKLQKFDVGIPAVAAQNLNNQYALGGKFFDYIIAGLAIAVPPLTAYKQFVEEYQIGIVSLEMGIQSLADQLNRTSSEQINQFKMESLKIAQQVSFDFEKKKLFEIYKSLISN
jgi:hypothetical protein